jgi:hypothetical protein
MKTNRFLLAAGLLLLVSFLLSCDGHTRVSGHVFDSKGQPVEKALVILETGGRKFDIATRKDGSFVVGLTHAPFEVQLSLSVTKEGFKPCKETFSSRSSPQGDHKIVLERDSSTGMKN